MLATLKDQVSEEHKGKTELTTRLPPSGSAAFSLSLYSCFVGANVSQTVSMEPWQAVSVEFGEIVHSCLIYSLKSEHLR